LKVNWTKDQKLKELTKEVKYKDSIIKDVDDLLQRKFAPAKWAVPGILPEGVSILAGKPKMGKSALALNIALAIVCGGKALGEIQVEKGEVLYFSLEDGERRLQDRIKKMLSLEEKPLEIVGFKYANDWPKREGFQILEQWLQNHHCVRLVIIDTLAKIRLPQRGRESIYDYDYQSVQEIKRIANEHRVCVLVLHHTRKSESEDAMEMISGSFGLSGAIDGALVLKRDRGKADAALHITGREIEEKELALQFKFPLWNLLGNAQEIRLSQERQAIISILREAEEALSPKEVHEILASQMGIKRSYANIKQLLYKMQNDGEVKSVERGKYKNFM
jgi:RecA-family ATPase